MALESLSHDEAAKRIQERLFPEPKAAASAKPDAAVEPAPDDPEPEAAAASGDDPDAPEQDSGPELEGDEAEAQPIQSLSDLAERLEIGEEDLAKLLKVKGRDGAEVALHDVLEAYRRPAPAEAELEATRTRLAELERDRGAYQEATRQLAQAAQGFAQRLKASEPDWALLERTNPQQFTIERLKYFEGLRQLEMADQQLRATREREQYEQQSKLQEFRTAEARKLQQQRPEWRDTKVFASDLEKTERYIIENYKFRPEDLQNLSDHRDWVIADKARRFDELSAKKPATLEKVRQLPKLMVPGAATNPGREAAARAAKAEDQLAARLRSTGSVDDAAKLIEQRIERSTRRAAARTLARRRV